MPLPHVGENSQIIPFFYEGFPKPNQLFVILGERNSEFSYKPDFNMSHSKNSSFEETSKKSRFKENIEMIMIVTSLER